MSCAVSQRGRGVPDSMDQFSPLTPVSCAFCCVDNLQSCPVINVVNPFSSGSSLPLLPDVAPTILSLFTESPLDLSVSIKTIIGPRSSPHTQEEWLLSIHILQKSSCLPFLLPRNSQKCDVPSLKMRGFYSARSSSKSNYFAPICCCQRECWYCQATLVIKAILLSSIIDLLKYSKPFRISLFSMCLRKEDRC